MTAFDRLAKKTAGVVARPVDEIKGQSDATLKTTRTAAISFHEGNERMHKAEKRSSELEVLLADEIANAKARDIALTELHEVPGRRRILSAEEYSSLKENLRQNTLVTPVTVRPKTEGGYEIISGNNRVAIYGELGRASILCVVLAMDETEADLAGFYANLMVPELCDFERYLGFKRRQLRTGKSQSEIAAEAGFPKSTVSRYFSFDKLRQDALNVLASHPAVLSSSTAVQLGAATEAGRADLVLEAIRRMIVNPKKFTQSQAVAFVNPRTNPKTYTTRSIKEGKKTLSTISVRGDKVIIDFPKQQIPDAWLDQFETLIRTAMVGVDAQGSKKELS
ncbi:ParB family chromosome partitioning protein [Oxalobacteraceae bacterium GrIS 1.11]